MNNWVRMNQRRVVRRAYLLPCRVVRERDFRMIGECAVDVSQDGMLVMTEHDVGHGEDLIVSFKATDLGIVFDTEAKVARIEQGRRPGDRGRALGVSFTSLDVIKRFILGSYFRRVPPPLPRRPQRIDLEASMNLDAARLAGKPPPPPSSRPWSFDYAAQVRRIAAEARA